VERDRVLARMEPIRVVVPQLWPFVLLTLDEVGLGAEETGAR
jgi:hypothetical protein